MAYELQGPVIREGSEILRGVDIVSPSARSKSTSDYYKIRVGLRGEDGTDWVGSWSQAAGPLDAGKPTSLLDSAQSNKRLRSGTSGVVEVTKIGSPADIVGMAVTFRTKRDGDTRGSLKPVLQAPATEDAAIRAVIDHINNGSREISHTVPLVAETPTSSSDSATFAAEHDYDSSTQSITSTSYVDSNVTITVTVPSGTTGYVLIHAGFSAYINSASGSEVFGAISDGSSEVVEKPVYCTFTGTQDNPCSLSYAEEITSTTTYTLRLKRTSHNATAAYQHISATASFV